MTAANTPGDTFATIYTNGTPGVYIPSMQERRIDVTGTELAEDMAGNLVAGIFAASDPCSVADSHGKVGAQESDEDELDPHATVLESQIENHTEERGDRPPEQLHRIPYCTDDAGKLVSFLMRFPEYCMYGRASSSGKHVAVLLGSLIDKEPKEIVVLSVEEDIRVSLVVGVQRSSKYFPRAIPFNVNFFDLAETTKGDPVLLVSCAFDPDGMLKGRRAATRATPNCTYLSGARKRLRWRASSQSSLLTLLVIGMKWSSPGPTLTTAPGS